MEKIAIVDEFDQIVDFKEKLYVHENALLHRAFSVILFNKNDEMLLQKRSSKKYHSPSLWTNACCSHQLECDKNIQNAAKRRLFQELGLLNIKLSKVGVIKYRCDFDDGLSENEIDHIFVGKYNGDTNYNVDEIDELKWIAIDNLKSWIDEKPEEFTYWFKMMIKQLKFSGVTL